MSSQTPALWGDLKPGRYSVGFKVLSSHDPDRKWRDGSKGRPIQTCVWYPAKPGDISMPMGYKDYFLLSANELDFADLTDSQKAEALRKYKGLLVSNGIPNEAVDALFSTQMFAVPSLEMEQGPFPLLIVAQGNFHSAHHQSVLCEFLASQGYVVATCPSQTRISGPMNSDADAYQSAVDQSNDIAFVKKQVIGKFKIDQTRIGLVGHSFGARSAFLYLAENKNIRGLVSLDGGIGNSQGKSFMKEAKEFDPNKIRVPILHFYEDIESFMTPDFDLIYSLRNSDRYLVKVEQMHHVQFTSFGMAGGTIPAFSDNARETEIKCESMFRIILNFVDAFVKNPMDTSGNQIDRVTEGAMPEGLMKLTRILPTN
jgi:dienelactone hydrolase